jgi:hypothetical protein
MTEPADLAAAQERYDAARAAHDAAVQRYIPITPGEQLGTPAGNLTDDVAEHLAELKAAMDEAEADVERIAGAS